MSNIKLFWLRDDEQNETMLEELLGEERPFDPELRQLIERNLLAVLGIRVLASNYPLHNNQDEKIPTLGLDENFRPVIVQYGSSAVNLNQGLFYLNWLLDHRADFKLLVLTQLDAEIDKRVAWHMPRLICIGERVAPYALHTAAQASVTVDMLRYRFHSSNLLLVERLQPPMKQDEFSAEVLVRLNSLLRPQDTAIQRLYLSLQQIISNIAPDLEIVVREQNIAFRRLRNFAMVQFAKQHIILFLNLNKDQVSFDDLSASNIYLSDSFTQWGQGHVEIHLTNSDQLANIVNLIQRSSDYA